MKKPIYLIYALIHPITNKICYIGYTTQGLKTRLRQHNSPKESNPTKIAKLKRSLKSLKFSIVELKRCETEEEMYLSEMQLIKKYSEKYKLYNIQEGGSSGKNPPESHRKAYETAIKRGTFALKGGRGSENPTAVINEQDVLEIYRLIKDHYTNEEILELFKHKCKISTIKALRSGQNWKHLFKQHFTKPLTSLKCEKSGYSLRVKLLIVKLLENGFTEQHINSKFKKISKSDLKRIKNKVIWKPIWERYESLKATLSSN